MNNRLVLHPAAHASAAAKLQISADAKVHQGSLLLSYKVEAPAAGPKVVWPQTQTKESSLDGEQRRDELWKTTCLEAFMLFLDGSYIEMNFAPEGLWAAYCFDSYREGMKNEGRINAVTDFKSTVITNASGNVYELSVCIDLSEAVKSPQHFRLGLTSVIETEGGERSYWSLKHSGEKPDFHDSQGHVLEMRI